MVRCRVARDVHSRKPAPQVSFHGEESSAPGITGFLAPAISPRVPLFAIQDPHDGVHLVRLIEVVTEDVAAGVVEIAGAAIDLGNGLRLAEPRHHVAGAVADAELARIGRFQHDLAQRSVALVKKRRMPSSGMARSPAPDWPAVG